MKHIVDTAEVESGWMVLKGHDPNRRMVKATLVIGEKAYTESEVREIIRGMIELLEGDPEQVLAAIEAVNAKHGLGLSDPA
jgi:hypothetical protein